MDKPIRETCPAYLDFIRSMPCIVPMCNNKSQAHHVESVGAGGSDFDAVPMCAAHHTGTQSVHSLGIETFQKTYNLNFDRMIAKMQRLYERLNDV